MRSLRRTLALGAGSLFLTIALPAQLVSAQTSRAALAVDRIEVVGAAPPNVNGQGIADMIVTDLVMQLAEAPFSDCEADVIAWSRRQDVLDEQALQQSELVDPETTVPEGGLVDPTDFIGGTVRVDGGALNWNLQISSAKDKAVKATVEGTAPLEDYLAVSKEMARQILEKACPKGYTASGGGPRITITGQVAALDRPFKLSGTFQGGTAEFSYAPSGPTGGNVSYSGGGSGVKVTGHGSYKISPQPDGSALVRQTTNGCVEGIPNSCRSNTDTITLTPR